MAFIVYLDETGNPTLEPEDEAFPIFVLVMLICDVQTYVREIVPAFYQLKMDYFGHEGVIIHSRDIRKSQGAYSFLTDPATKQPFYERLNGIMGDTDYRLIATAIHKQRLKERYRFCATNPYELALKFALERLLPLLEQAGQTSVQLVAESRGTLEDSELRTAFERFVTFGTDYIPAARFSQIDFRLAFEAKLKNTVGTQMADLAGYPIARQVLDPDKSHPSWPVIADKFYKGPGRIYGLKVFP